MITYLKGTLAYKGELPGGGAYLVVDVGGVGYQVHTSALSFQKSPPANDAILVHTSMLVREDAMQLVGFLTREERELFDILGTASGVGFKVALSLMSELTVPDLVMAIMAGDHKRLTAAKGVGPKLAQKIAIELKDKMTKWRECRTDTAFLPMAGGEPLPQGQAFQEAEAVLLSLGYSLGEVHQGLGHLQKTHATPDTLSSEEVLQQILKWLATHPVQS